MKVLCGVLAFLGVAPFASGQTAQKPLPIPSVIFGQPVVIAEDGTYLGRLSRSRFDPESVENPYGVYGSRFSPASINNPYGSYGSAYGPLSARNPYTFSAPRVFDGDTGRYLGRLSANRYAVDSLENRYGLHGSLYGSRARSAFYPSHVAPFGRLPQRDTFDTTAALPEFQSSRAPANDPWVAIGNNLALVIDSYVASREQQAYARRVAERERLWMRRQKDDWWAYVQSRAHERQVPAPSGPENPIVYVLRWGAYYHTSSCSLLREHTSVPVALSEVQAAYKPCGLCRPTR